MNRQRVPSIFSADRRRARIARAAKSARSDRFVVVHMADDIADRLAFMRREAGKACIIGDSGGVLAHSLSAEGFDISSPNEPHDDESPLPGAPFDLIVNMGRLDTVNDLPGALLHLRNALAEDGLFIGQLLGAGSLPMLRQIMLAADGDRPAARIHPQVDNRAATALLERALFKRQVVDTHTLSVSYCALDKLVSDLRNQGLNSALADAPPPLSRPALKRAHAAFDALAGEDGRVTETFEILTLTGWR